MFTNLKMNAPTTPEQENIGLVIPDGPKKRSREELNLTPIKLSFDKNDTKYPNAPKKNRSS